MTNVFEFIAPTRVRFGSGARWNIPERLSGTRWGLLSDDNVLARSGIGAVLDEARSLGTEIHEIGRASPNPRLSEVEEALQRAVSLGVRGVLAVGGGSVLDAGKLLRSALQHGVAAREVLDDMASVAQAPIGTRVALIAVPTTAGTGAEVSKGAIITDAESRSKRAARAPELIPDEAVIDPELSLSLPRRLTAETGFDVIAHALETFLSRASNSVTEIFSLAAIDAVPSALIQAVDDGGDLEARTTLALHAWLMGYNLAHASTCLPHRMQYPIGAATDTSHQIGLAAIYPSWMRAVRSASEDRFATIMNHFRTGLANRLTAAESGLGDLDLFSWYLERLGIRVGLEDLGIDESGIADLVHGTTGRMDLDPLDPTPRTIEHILRESLSAGQP